MEAEIAVVDRRGASTPLFLAAAEQATVAGLRAALAGPLGRPVPPGTLLLDGAPLADGTRLDRVGLTTGATVQVDQTGPAAPEPAGGGRPELAVVGGLAAGASVRLPPGGALVLGRATGADLVVDDPEVSRRHAEVRGATATGPAGELAGVTDLGSRNGTSRRGHLLAGPTGIGAGDLLQAGETVFAVRPAAAADAQVTVDAAGGVVRFNRPPRIPPPTVEPEVTVPGEPERPRGFRFPLGMVLVPLLAAGVVFALFPNQAYFLIFLALSPLMAIGHYLTERRGGHKEYRDKERRYRAELAAAHARLDQLATEEERTTRAALPDPAALARIATGPTSRLFERRPADPDFLRLRVGLVDRPSGVRLVGPGAAAEPARTVYAVPVAVDVAAAGVVGVAGPRRSVLPAARALLAQAATLHAPHDLGIVLLTGADQAPEWEWASWLPHTLPHRADLACHRMVATDLAQAEARIAELRRITDERRAEQRERLADAPPGRRLLVVMDGARRLRDLPGLASLLADGPEVGVYALCLDTAEPNLPDECRVTAVATSPSGTRFRVSRPGQPPDGDVLADGVPRRLADRVARALAPVRVLGARFGDDEGLPDTVRLLELAGLGTDPKPGQIADRWAVRGSPRALIGVGPAGPVEVDLRRDGPHALVAGTSGAGKSELLQTLVAALALDHPPDALTFVLVDYKGGSAFAECRYLPHCVGLVTDLDGHLVNRALASLSAELRRREAILAGAGAKDIEDYWALTGGRLPRLVIVVDEFASLVEEVPEFVTGVVGIGMRGRSLGVHVVLATQRPGGVVTAELRANVNLRICLRVTSTSESTDVVDVPDAARISRHHPGRGYLRTGHTDLAVLQAARVGWPRAKEPASRQEADLDRVTVRPRRMVELGRGPVTEPAEPAAGHDGDTDLTVLVAAVRAAAGQLDLHPPASPWLPPLPEQVTIAELDGIDPAPAGSVVTVPLGLADHPAQQAQTTFALDLEQAGPVAVAGMARTGRSTTLRTLAAVLAAQASPADVHLYALDYGRALAPLAGLPHCGAWVGVEEPDRAERLLALLSGEVARRQRLLGAGGFGSLREQRAAVGPADRLPYLVLLVDPYEAFLDRHQEVDGGRLVELVEGLLRRGPATGVLTVLATDRSGFGHRLAGAVPTRLVLRQADPDQVSAFGLHPREVPGSLPPGRAVAVPYAVELQVALLEPDPDGAAQAAAVERLAARLAGRWDGLDPARRPHRVDPLPESVTEAELVPLRTAARPGGPAVCTIGAGGDHLGPVDIDLAEAGSTLLIAGPPGSGRSTALVALVNSLAGRAAGLLPVVAVCPRPSPLRRLAGQPGIAAVVSGGDLAERLPEVLAGLAGPAAVVVDDAELLADSAVADRLEQLTRTARDQGSLVVAAGTTEDLLGQRYRGWLAMLRRSRCGLLLNPGSPVDGEVFDAKLPRSTGGGWPAGRALLVWRGATTPVQVPLPADLVPAVASGQRADGE